MAQLGEVKKLMILELQACQKEVQLVLYKQ